MAEIFVSHSPLDRERVRPIAERLSSLGYSVWWDSAADRRSTLAERESELNRSRAVLAVWTKTALNATQMHAEAVAALDAGKLVHMKLEPISLPEPFDLADAYDPTGAGEWGPLEHDLMQLVRDAQTRTHARPHLGLPPMLAPAGLPRLVTTALAATLAAYWGAVSAASSGAMSPAQLQVLLLGAAGVAGACLALSILRIVLTARAGG